MNDRTNEYAQALGINISVPIERRLRKGYIGEEQKIISIVHDLDLFLHADAATYSRNEGR